MSFKAVILHRCARAVHIHCLNMQLRIRSEFRGAQERSWAANIPGPPDVSGGMDRLLSERVKWVKALSPRSSLDQIERNVAD